MTERVFIDTNVLIYADDLDAGAKRDVARNALRQVLGSRAFAAVLSTQVLQEFFVVATRKLGVAPAVARRKIELLCRYDVVTVQPDLILGAIDLTRLQPISFWDALIVKTAHAAGCGRILTEDLNHGDTIDGVRIENPFLEG